MRELAIVLIILIILGAFGGPMLGYWGYGWGPTGGPGLLVLILIILLLTGRL